MPNKWPITSGNWSTASIWNGGTKPGVGDDVFANNQSVYIDETVTVLTLRNAASASAILAGGSFYLNNGVTANLTAANALVPAVANVPLIIISSSNSARLHGTLNVATSTGTMPVITMLDSSSLTISGSFTGAASGQNTNLSGSIVHNSSGSLIITGSVQPNGGGSLLANAISMLGNGSTYITGSLTSGNGGNGIVKAAGSGSIFIVTSNLTNIGGNNIVKSSFGNIDITGNITVSATIIINSAPGTIRVNGNLIGGGPFFNAIQNSGANTLITVTGSIISAGTGTAHTILNTGNNATIIISGSINAGTTSGTTSAAGISLQTNPATIIVSGSVIGGTNPSISYGIASSVAGNIIVSGSVTAGTGAPAINASAGNVFVTGPFLNTNNRNAIYAVNMQLISGSTPTWQFDTETYGGTKILYTSGSVTGYPSISNVRNGVIYGDTNQFTGTVVIPAASNVIRGALVDNTTGSASFTTQNAWSAATGSLTVSGSIGARLQNTATVNTDATLITTRRKL